MLQNRQDGSQKFHVVFMKTTKQERKGLQSQQVAHGVVEHLKQQQKSLTTWAVVTKRAHVKWNVRYIVVEVRMLAQIVLTKPMWRYVMEPIMAVIQGLLMKMREVVEEIVIIIERKWTWNPNPYCTKNLIDLICAGAILTLLL